QVGLGPDRLVVGETEAAGGPGKIAVLDRIADRSQRGVDGPEEREQPDPRHDDRERVEGDASGPDPARCHRRSGVAASGGGDHAHDVVLITRERNTMIGPSEISNRMTAIADPKPTRLASLMLLLVSRIDSSSSPFLPWLTLNAISKSRSASIVVITATTTWMAAITGKTRRKKGCI